MTTENDNAAYDLYAEIGRYLTKFNMLEVNLRLIFERAVGSKFGPVLGHVQSISTRLDMVMTALKAFRTRRHGQARSQTWSVRFGQQ